MGGHGVVRSKRIKTLLQALEVSSGKFEFSQSKHSKIRFRDTGETYPIPLSHKWVDSFIVAKLAEKLEKNEVCCKDWFIKEI